MPKIWRLQGGSTREWISRHQLSGVREAPSGGRHSDLHLRPPRVRPPPRDTYGGGGGRGGLRSGADTAVRRNRRRLGSGGGLRHRARGGGQPRPGAAAARALRGTGRLVRTTWARRRKGPHLLTGPTGPTG